MDEPEDTAQRRPYRLPGGRGRGISHLTDRRGGRVDHPPAQLPGGLVDGEPGAARGDLQDVTVGIAQVDRLEVGAVEHLRAADAAGLEVLAPPVKLVL